MKIQLTAELPDALYGPFLQHLRDFDTKHDPRHEGIVKFYTATNTEMTAEEISKIAAGIYPPLLVKTERKFD
jgi:hypothetical protein